MALPPGRKRNTVIATIQKDCLEDGVGMPSPSLQPDLLRSMLFTFVQALTSAAADAIGFDARAGVMAVAIPKLREGSYSSDVVAPSGRCARGQAGHLDVLHSDLVADIGATLEPAR